MAGEDSNPRDGLLPIVLEKPWAGSAKGDTVRVDAERMAWLESNGFMVAARKVAEVKEILGFPIEIKAPTRPLESAPVFGSLTGRSQLEQTTQMTQTLAAQKGNEKKDEEI